MGSSRRVDSEVANLGGTVGGHVLALGETRGSDAPGPVLGSQLRDGVCAPVPTGRSESRLGLEPVVRRGDGVGWIDRRGSDSTFSRDLAPVLRAN